MLTVGHTEILKLHQKYNKNVNYIANSKITGNSAL